MQDKIQEKIEKEITRRRTFAIISHPDAGKTTLTDCAGGGSQRQTRPRRYVGLDGNRKTARYFRDFIGHAVPA